eukprot:SAG31_NODE_10796_length_1096_cov_1.551655_1_plen_150_part_00
MQTKDHRACFLLCSPYCSLILPATCLKATLSPGSKLWAHLLTTPSLYARIKSENSPSGFSTLTCSSGAAPMLAQRKTHRSSGDMLARTGLYGFIASEPSCSAPLAFIRIAEQTGRSRLLPGGSSNVSSLVSDETWRLDFKGACFHVVGK